MKFVVLIFQMTLFLLADCTITNGTSYLNNIDSKPQLTVRQTTGRRSFYEKSPFTNRFVCDSTKDILKFTWIYVWNDGDITLINVNNRQAQNGMRKDSVRFSFPSKNITHVLCVAEDSTGRKFNGSYEVYINEATEPRILNEPLQNPIWFKIGLKLKCIATGSPLNFSWLKNEKPMESRSETQTFGVISSSELLVNPRINEAINATYTCVARNFIATKRFDFPVAFLIA